MKTQRLFEKSLDNFKPPRPPKVKAVDRLKLHKHQVQAFRKLRKSRHVILNAPTGWGKSVVIIFLVVWKLCWARRRGLRCIIAVPQTVIADSFKRAAGVSFGKRLETWLIRDLCSREPNKTRALIEFLKGPNEKFQDRVCVCSHATLAKAYRKLKRRRHLFANTVVWVDEAHHVMNAQVQGGGEVSNTLGALVRYLITGPNTHVALATATFMRGDMRNILPDELAKKFTRHDIPYDEYFNRAAPVKSFSFDVMCADPIEGIARLFKKKCPTIIYLAKRQSKLGRGCKYKEVDAIVRRLAKQMRVSVRREGHFKMLGSLKMLDLVSEKGREKRKDSLQDADIIIALDMCKEGFDWPKAERCIIIGERHSVPEMIQMIGRLFRKHEGKRHADIVQILPPVIRNTKEFHEARNDCLTVVFSAMLLEDVFMPVCLSGEKRGPRLADIVPDTEAWDRLMRDYRATLMDAQKNGVLTWEDSLPYRKSLLNKHGIPASQHEAVWKKLWTMCALVTRRMKGLNVKNISFKMLKHVDISEGLLKLSSGLCGKVTFAELRTALGGNFKTAEQWVPVAERLAEENGGLLPNPSRLQQSEYSALEQAMRSRPDLFTHIPQDSKKGKTPEEWVAVAESLAEKHNGKLPCCAQLIFIGLEALYQAMCKYAELFDHIPQDSKRGRKPEEWVPIAEKLAVEHGGTLRTQAWLNSNYYTGLVSAIRKEPHLFDHITKSKGGRKPEEWVPIAEELAAEHGRLPHYYWLTRNKYSGLARALTKRPELFRHIKQTKLGPGGRRTRTPEQWVIFAEKLARRMGGKLPRPGQLGLTHRQLYCVMRKHSNLFKHITQERKRVA